MFGSTYHLIRWLSTDGKKEESWIPSIGLTVDPRAYNMPVPDSIPVLEESEYETQCNTSKEKIVRRKKTAGVNLVLFPCGIILSVDELYGSESLSQVLLPIYALMKNEGLREDVKVLIHDNACKFAAFVQKRRDETTLMSHLSTLDMRVDRHHFKNHVGAKCRRNHNPDTCELLDGVNTSCMEQVNSWFGRYRHSSRYMNESRFAFYLLLACHLNNRYRAYKQTTNAAESSDEDDSQSH